ncbi:hypothetical protein J6590_092504 [Homalodisca vitripennis]|nr:hypothetical protein J6590_092504 [Homalodisca vitripennis]
MWIFVPLTISIIATASGYVATVDAQPYWSYQGYPGSPSYNGWSAPTGNEELGLLQMVSRRRNDKCRLWGGMDEVSGIPGLRNGIQYSYFDIIKATMNEIFDNFGIDRRDAYIYADNMCTRNSEKISLLPDREVVNMLCSHVHETVDKENL